MGRPPAGGEEAADPGRRGARRGGAGAGRRLEERRGGAGRRREERREGAGAGRRREAVRGSRGRERERERECVRARMFGGGGSGVRVMRIYIFLCVHFFCAFFKNRQNKLYFSVSFYFSVCLLSRTEKCYNYSVGFRVFLSGYFDTDRIIVIFLCVPKKTHRKIHHPQKYSSFQ